MSFLDTVKDAVGINEKKHEEKKPVKKDSVNVDSVVQTILDKIQHIQDDSDTKIHDLREELTEQIESLQEGVQEAKKSDVKDPRVDDLEDRVAELEEVIDSFTGIYEAISNQYSPFSKNTSDTPKKKELAEKAAEPPVNEIPRRNKHNEEPEIKVKDSLSGETKKVPKQNAASAPKVKENPTISPDTEELIQHNLPTKTDVTSV